MSYINEHKTTITFETIPEPCPEDKDVTLIHVGYSDDIDLPEDSEEYRATMRELSVNLTRTLFLTMTEKGVFSPDELALVLAEKVYLPLKSDLLALQNGIHLDDAETTIKEIVLYDREEEDEDDQ